MTTLTAAHLRKVLDYNPLTGVFLWRISPTNNTPAGSVAGGWHNGYRRIKIDAVGYLAHRLAWLYCYGVWPPATLDLDHQNNIHSDNRLANLRLATRSQNMANRRVSSASRCGLKGVSPNTRGFMARIRKDGRDIHLGTFPTPDEAHAAYVRAAVKLHGEFARAA